MEIIVFPYLAISFLIAWAVFSPFAGINNLDEWTFSRIRSSDLLAIFLPLSALLAFFSWASPTGRPTAPVLAILACSILLFALFVLFAGLFLLAKMDQTNFLKRMAIIGVIIPFGTFLTIAWIAVPLLAFAGSIHYSLPATLAIIPVILILRGMSTWACQGPNVSG